MKEFEFATIHHSRILVYDGVSHIQCSALKSKKKKKLCTLTVHGPCIQGSPSICIGKVFFVVIITSLHCANLLPDDRSPVLTCPM